MSCPARSSIFSPWKLQKALGEQSWEPQRPRFSALSGSSGRNKTTEYNGPTVVLVDLVGVQTVPSFGGKIDDGIEEFDGIVGLPKNWGLTGLIWDILFETNRYIGI